MELVVRKWSEISLIFFETLGQTNSTYYTSETINSSPQTQPQRVVTVNLRNFWSNFVILICRIILLNIPHKASTSCCSCYGESRRKIKVEKSFHLFVWTVVIIAPFRGRWRTSGHFLFCPFAINNHTWSSIGYYAFTKDFNANLWTWITFNWRNNSI